MGIYVVRLRSKFRHNSIKIGCDHDRDVSRRLTHNWAGFRPQHISVPRPWLARIPVAMHLDIAIMIGSDFDRNPNGIRSKLESDRTATKFRSKSDRIAATIAAPIETTIWPNFNRNSIRTDHGPTRVGVRSNSDHNPIGIARDLAGLWPNRDRNLTISQQCREAGWTQGVRRCQAWVHMRSRTG